MFANESIKNSLSCSSFVVNFRYCAADYVGQSYIRVTNSVDFFCVEDLTYARHAG